MASGLSLSPACSPSCQSWPMPSYRPPRLNWITNVTCSKKNRTPHEESIMHFKMIIVFVEDRKTDAVMDAAREAGATGATVIHNARGEGMKVSKTFFGLSLETQRDVILFLVEEHLSR